MPSTKNITPDENIMGFYVSTKNAVIFQNVHIIDQECEVKMAVQKR